MSPYKARGIRSQWTEKDLKRAIRARQNGESKNSASKLYKIPRRTLNRYMNKNTTLKQLLDRKSVLNEDQERELAARIIRLAQVGYPLTKRMLRKCVFNYCQLNGLSNMFSQKRLLAGRQWLKAFLKRDTQRLILERPRT
ncbi:hypothetical protein JTB14_003551 [Gonioctena quinquepunctata]|nr:hypothetical protein JTB14_003551 [Gonioctena quinquepunctata]